MYVNLHIYGLELKASRSISYGFLQPNSQRQQAIEDSLKTTILLDHVYFLRKESVSIAAKPDIYLF